MTNSEDEKKKRTEADYFHLALQAVDLYFDRLSFTYCPYCVVELSEPEDTHSDLACPSCSSTFRIEALEAIHEQAVNSVANETFEDTGMTLVDMQTKRRFFRPKCFISHLDQKKDRVANLNRLIKQEQELIAALVAPSSDEPHPAQMIHLIWSEVSKKTLEVLQSELRLESLEEQAIP